MITPFRQGRVDTAAAQALVERFVAAGCTGVVVCGTTGEPATMSDAEQQLLLDAVIEAAAGRLGLVFGLAGNDTSEVARRAAELSDQPIDGLLVSAPYYLRPSQAGVLQHFEAIGRRAGRPIVLYNIPYRTGVEISLDTCRRLSERPNVVAIKESGGDDLDRLTALITQTGLKVLSGEDRWLMLNACLGGHGAIAAAAHVRPDLYARILADVEAGRILRARQTFLALMPLIHLLFAEPNPTVIKAALARQGLITEELRLPLVPAGEDIRRRLAPMLDEVAALA